MMKGDTSLFECMMVTRAVSGVRREATSAGITTPFRKKRCGTGWERKKGVGVSAKVKNGR
jgi:hypothetical protein